ncbi:hypothetical protein PHLH7_53690 [Pseudomonas sp. Ost2]|nr:hypothetical protein PHLH7_53690 [Pseudomonas sp. Ost2]
MTRRVFKIKNRKMKIVEFKHSQAKSLKLSREILIISIKQLLVLIASTGAQSQLDAGYFRGRRPTLYSPGSAYASPHVQFYRYVITTIPLGETVVMLEAPFDKGW